MSIKTSKLYSIFTSKCPQCRQGNLFLHKSSFNILSTTKTKDNCNVCGIKYMREPSFFYGAMYVGYALSVAIGVALYVISSLIFGLSMKQSLFVIAGGLIVLAPWNSRLARVVWIYFFVKYKKNSKDWIK